MESTGRLLSAAELHGAAHHLPQEFQVICDTPHRAIHLARYLGSQSPRITSLRPDLDSESTELNKKWNLYINDQIELEE